VNYIIRRLNYLLRNPAFHENPLLILRRCVVWLIYCLIGRSPRFALADGVMMTVKPVLRQSGSTSAFVLRTWAEPELRYLHLLLRKGGAFIDCGANIGIYTTYAAGIVGPTGTVIAIEPGEMSYSRLKRNVELNAFAQVKLVKMAISDRKSVARLYHADGGPVSFSLVPKAGTEFEEVETTTIDALVAEAGIQRLDCIKLDVEGVEILALQGARDSICRMRPAVIFERTSAGSRRAGILGEVPHFLTSFGYRLYISRYGNANVVAIHPQGDQKAPDVLVPWSPPDG
jgi:FkbM family methyltransferase